MNEDVSPRTSFLFANPSVIDGLARILDVGATFDAYNTSPTEQAADERAQIQDWYSVGDDLRSAMGLPPRKA